MSRHDDRISLAQMLDHAREAVAMAAGRTRHELDTDRMLMLALTRLIEIVGEAARRVSKKARSEHPDIPWSQIVGMRDRLIHGYDVVDPDLLWDTIELDLPPLVMQLRQVLETRNE